MFVRRSTLDIASAVYEQRISQQGDALARAERERDQLRAELATAWVRNARGQLERHPLNVAAPK